MATNSKIEWTNQTWNPVVGCTRASSGCDHCYAVTMTKRLAAIGQTDYQGLVGNGNGHFNGTVRTLERRLPEPLRWRKPRRVFVNSMSDLFHKDVPFDFVDQVFAVMALCPQHTFQILTKRPERMAEYMNDSRHDRVNAKACDLHKHTRINIIPERLIGYPRSPVKVWPLPNCWTGTSIENQATADERIPHLLRVPAAVRFLSVEPLLGPVEFSDVTRRSDAVHQWGKKALSGIDWVIVGGESGLGARPCDIAWIRSIVSQSKAAGAACFVKQLGAKPYEDADNGPAVRSWGDAKIQRNGACIQIHLADRKGGDMNEWPEDLRVREYPLGQVAEEV